MAQGNVSVRQVEFNRLPRAVRATWVTAIAKPDDSSVYEGIAEVAFKKLDGTLSGAFFQA